jgi:hypothetical protein
MLLVWPFSLFNAFLARVLILPVERVLPWFGFALRNSLFLVSAVTTAFTPLFVFLTFINNANDRLSVRVAFALVHALWWSLVIVLVGGAFLMVAFGVPALVADLVLMVVGK